MKKIKELLMVNDTGMSIGLLIMITVFIPVMTRKNLFYGLSPCLYDVYINLSMYGTGPVLVPFVLFYILYVERHNFSAMMVIRYKNKSSIWKKCVKDLALMCAIAAIYTYIVATVSGLLLTHTVYNWNIEDSRCFDQTRQLCQFPPSLLFISFTYILQSFSVFFIMGLIMMALWWISDKKWVGYLCAIVVMLIQSNDKLNQISKGLLWRKSVISYGLYKKGINIPNNILLPIVASVSVLIVTSLLVRLKKKEFLENN